MILKSSFQQAILNKLIPSSSFKTSITRISSVNAINGYVFMGVINLVSSFAYGILSAGADVSGSEALYR